jgi:beta-lactamase superfamily II metal-dependent hydrolase
MKRKQLISLVVAVIVIFSAVYGLLSNGDDESDKTQSVVSRATGTVSVHFFDVGQGDSEMIELENGQCILIDAGDSEHANSLVQKIKALGYSKIDYLVATHPHADHIGGMEKLVTSFDIGEIFMPRASTNTKTYESLLQAISDKGLTITTAKAGKTLYSSDDTQIKFIAPLSDSYEELNNYSAVIRLDCGNTSFLFMGDAEKEVEDELLSAYSRSELDCDVLKVGHHGSRYSSTSSFLSAVSPTYAVIEVAQDNSYGHPHSQTLTRLNDVGARVLCTDEESDITITTDGSELWVN